MVCICCWSNSPHHARRHSRNEVNLSLPFRLAGITPNATLELRPKRANSSSSQPVTVGIQLPSRRLVATFSPATTLWEILRTFERTELVFFCGFIDTKASSPCALWRTQLNLTVGPPSGPNPDQYFLPALYYLNRAVSAKPLPAAIFSYSTTSLVFPCRSTTRKPSPRKRYRD